MKSTYRILTLIGFGLFFGCGNNQSKVQSNADNQEIVASENQSENRKTFNETIEILRELGIVDEHQNPIKPKTIPQYDDKDPAGLSIIRTGLENKDLSNLDMQRTFFNRSELVECSFENTDLRESNLCWNDFIKVNFSGADLSDADLRASIYENVYFTGSNLSGTDLRRSYFKNCDFTSANMSGAKLTKDAGKMLALSDKQQQEIDWQENEGEEPNGG